MRGDAAAVVAQPLVQPPPVSQVSQHCTDGAQGMVGVAAGAAAVSMPHGCFGLHRVSPSTVQTTWMSGEQYMLGAVAVAAGAAAASMPQAYFLQTVAPRTAQTRLTSGEQVMVGALAAGAAGWAAGDAVEQPLHG